MPNQNPPDPEQHPPPDPHSGTTPRHDLGPDNRNPDNRNPDNRNPDNPGQADQGPEDPDLGNPGYGEPRHQQPDRYPGAGYPPPPPQSGYAPPGYREPEYPVAGYPQPGSPYGPPVQPPGKILGIVGFIISLLGPLTFVGLIISIVAMVQSRKAKVKNGFALTGIIIGIVGTAILIFVIIIATLGFMHLAQICSDLGPGVHQQDGITYTCGG